MTRRMDVYVELDKDTMLGDFLRAVHEKSLSTTNVQREGSGDKTEMIRAFSATLIAQRRHKHEELLEQIREIPGVVFVEEL